MPTFNRSVVLNTLIKHETMTLEYLVKGKNFNGTRRAASKASVERIRGRWIHRTDWRN